MAVCRKWFRHWLFRQSRIGFDSKGKWWNRIWCFRCNDWSEEVKSIHSDKTFVGDIESADTLVKMLAEYFYGEKKPHWISDGMHTNGGPDPWPNDSSAILTEARRLAYDLKSHAIWHRGGELVERLVRRIKQLEYGQIGKVPL